MNKEQLKEEVRTYWNAAPCGTEFIKENPSTKKYFDEIENFRYSVEPEIFAFAQFTRYHGKKILEVGVGAGTDFVQWVRAGAHAYGIDLTSEGVAHTQQRLSLENLQAKELHVADAESIPYANNMFDLVYSWGVIHHAPDTVKCLEEIIRVTKPGGTIKIMIYNRRALFAYYQWIRNGLLKGKPFRNIATVLFNYQESKGTKAYTFKEIKHVLYNYSVKIKKISAPVTSHDLLYYKARPWQWLAYLLACFLGWQRCGWFMMVELEKQ